jgi:hypothetical protein
VHCLRLRLSPDAAIGLGAAVETRQRRGYLGRWIDEEPSSTGESSADKSEGRRKDIKEGREERRDGAVLLYFDRATGVSQQGRHTGSGHLSFLMGFCRLALYKYNYYIIDY